MPYFNQASQFEISGGTFHDVGGDQTIYNNSRHTTNTNSHNRTNNNTYDSYNTTTRQDYSTHTANYGGIGRDVNTPRFTQNNNSVSSRGRGGQSQQYAAPRGLGGLSHQELSYGEMRAMTAEDILYLQQQLAPVRHLQANPPGRQPNRSGSSARDQQSRGYGVQNKRDESFQNRPYTGYPSGQQVPASSYRQSNAQQYYATPETPSPPTGDSTFRDRSTYSVPPVSQNYYSSPPPVMKKNNPFRSMTSTPHVQQDATYTPSDNYSQSGPNVFDAVYDDAEVMEGQTQKQL